VLTLIWVIMTGGSFKIVSNWAHYKNLQDQELKVLPIMWISNVYQDFLFMQMHHGPLASVKPSK